MVLPLVVIIEITMVEAAEIENLEIRITEEELAKIIIAVAIDTLVVVLPYVAIIKEEAYEQVNRLVAATQR